VPSTSLLASVCPSRLNTTELMPMVPLVKAV
jgi:hypothetical protein